MLTRYLEGFDDGNAVSHAPNRPNPRGVDAGAPLSFSLAADAAFVV